MRAYVCMCLCVLQKATRGNTRRSTAHGRVGDPANSEGVYKSLYRQLKKSGVGPHHRTFVYPLWLCEVIHQRCGVISAHFDEQYEDDDKVYHVTETDLLCTTWNDPGDCVFCNEAMLTTP